MQKLIIILFLLLYNKNFPQVNFNGQVIDFDTTVPIAYATITYNSKTLSTDWEGKFKIIIVDEMLPIIFSYKGYLDKIYYLNTTDKFLLIKMVRSSALRKEIVLSDQKVNLIIKKVIQNKAKTNPERALKNFEYKNYESLTVSANADSISSKIDTIIKKRWFRSSKIVLDSTNYKFKRLAQKQHIYQTEKVNLFQHNAIGNKETVLASRMAGFKKPLYEYLGLDLISYSVYNNTIKILEIPIQNPISNYGRKIFVFKLIDSTFIDNRKVYKVYFQPKKLNINSLRGLLFIDAQNFSVAKAFYRIYGLANIEARYSYSFLKSENLWFPKNRKIMVVKGSNTGNLDILGKSIKFNSNISDRLKIDASDNIFLKLESTPFDIQINNNTFFKNRYIKIDVPENSLSKPNDYWSQLTNDTIDYRKINTYSNLDSLSKAEKIEQKIYIGRKIVDGFYPIKFIDIDLRSILKFNNFEGFRLGLGVVTNNKLAQNYKLSLYGAYGLKDKNFKYGFTPSYLINKASNTWINLSVANDLAEIASTHFAIDGNAFRLYDSRPINISTFYDNKSISAFVESKFIPKSDSYFGVSRSLIKPLFDYSFRANDESYTNFNVTMARFSIQWNPASKYMQTPAGRLEIQKKFPKIALQYTKSFAGVVGSDFNFSNLDVRLNHQIPFISGHKLSFMLQAGRSFGDAPLTHLYSISPNNLPIERPIDYIAIAGENSFETMYFNEFFSTKFSSFQVKYFFNKVKLGYKFSPEIALATRMAFGTFENQQRHNGFQFKTLDKGFYESGFELNKIWNGFGLNCFYRHGGNALNSLKDNLSVKLSFVLDFGF